MILRNNTTLIKWKRRLYYCRRVCAKLLQSCLTLFNPMDCSLPGSSVHGISQARILEWVAVPSSRGSSRPRDPSRISYVSCIGSWFFTLSAAWEAPVFSQSGASNPRLKTMLLSIACITCHTSLIALLPELALHHPSPWKNCLTQKLSSEPKRLVTIALNDLKTLSNVLQFSFFFFLLGWGREVIIHNIGLVWIYYLRLKIFQQG